LHRATGLAGPGGCVDASKRPLHAPQVRAGSSKPLPAAFFLFWTRLCSRNADTEIQARGVSCRGIDNRPTCRDTVHAMRWVMGGGSKQHTNSADGAQHNDTSRCSSTGVLALRAHRDNKSRRAAQTRNEGSVCDVGVRSWSLCRRIEHAAQARKRTQASAGSARLLDPQSIRHCTLHCIPGFRQSWFFGAPVGGAQRAASMGRM
jgi:hypothetical protein